MSYVNTIKNMLLLNDNQNSSLNNYSYSKIYDKILIDINYMNTKILCHIENIISYLYFCRTVHFSIYYIYFYFITPFYYY